jgi:hypothetical protein
LDINLSTDGYQAATWSRKIFLNTSLVHPKQIRVATFGMQLVNKPQANKPPVATPPAVGPQLSPEERAYNAERSRIAQLTEQNPEFQNIGQLRNDLRDQGMAIWQQKYGNTPLGQPGGAIGRKNPLMEEFFGYQTGMSPQQMQEMQATAAPVPVAPGEIPYQQGDLGTRATLETGYDPAQYGLSPNLVEEMKKRLLQQAGK